MKWLKSPKNIRGFIKVNFFKYLQFKAKVWPSKKDKIWNMKNNNEHLFKNFNMSNIGSKISSDVWFFNLKSLIKQTSHFVL